MTLSFWATLSLWKDGIVEDRDPYSCTGQIGDGRKQKKSPRCFTLNLVQTCLVVVGLITFQWNWCFPRVDHHHCRMQV